MGRMKKWSGGTLIFILFLSYSFLSKVKQPQPQPHYKQSAADFFNNNQQQPEEEDNIISSSSVQLNRQRPNLVHVQGLAVLYSLILSVNISQGDYHSKQVFLAWDQMQDLLSRSDALPETAYGIKEAAVAWKQLLSSIQDDDVDSNHADCPYFVTASDMITTSTTKGEGAVVVLQIPCGLVEDSSITVIGIPDGSFHIELVGGSQLPNETQHHHPAVLYYDVHMPGEDNVKEEPVIVQNTWTKELGWGKEERCPNHRSSNTMEVDGLWKCNERVLSSFENNNLNASRHASTGGNISSTSAHASVAFPFVEGIPFTATIRVGLQGFHVTVNGRHETSFAYRENLEPWLVSGVKVAGSLNLISALAKGLPVSEDMDIVDIKHLRAPQIPNRRLVLLVAVFSTGNNFERRMALRRSWMQYEAIRSGHVAVRFFIGLHKNKEVNFQIWKEAQAYGDIQLMPFVDYYSLLSLKTIAMCIFGTKILPAKYIMKTDDDAFIRIDEVLSSLKGKVTDGLLYGLVSFESSPHRDKDNKWYISVEEWPHASYPPWAHGPGYIISRDIARFIVQGHHKRSLQLFKLEDVAVGIWIEQFKGQGHKVEYVNDDRFYNAGCEPNYILAHYQNPRKLLCLWEKIQKDQKPECCE